MATTLPTGRLEAFSDGVFAIAITLLVLEISVPSDAGDDLLDAFLDQWPSYLAYLVSFATIGVTWLRHSAICHYLHGVDTTFVRLNLSLLMFVSLLPFPTGLVADHIHEESAERVAVTILGVNLLVVAALISAMWRHAIRRQLVRPGADDDEIRLVTQRLMPSLAGYVVVILLGLVLPVAAVIGYLAIALVLLAPVGLGRSGPPHRPPVARPAATRRSQLVASSTRRSLASQRRRAASSSRATLLGEAGSHLA